MWRLVSAGFVLVVENGAEFNLPALQEANYSLAAKCRCRGESGLFTQCYQLLGWLSVGRGCGDWVPVCLCSCLCARVRGMALVLCFPVHIQEEFHIKKSEHYKV